MAAFFTKSEARSAAGGVLQKSFGTTYGRVLKESRDAATDTDVFDVFMSHSIRDAELIVGAKELLERQGLSVYVDWINDPQMDRSEVTSETAAMLRRRMRQSHSLIYVATENATASKWMPWELGYFDGFRPGQVAVMPLLETGGEKFLQQEYLGLYPIVRKDTYGSGAQDVFVESIGARWATLKNFGNGAPKWQPYT